MSASARKGVVEYLSPSCWIVYTIIHLSPPQRPRAKNSSASTVPAIRSPPVIPGYVQNARPVQHHPLSRRNMLPPILPLLPLRPRQRFGHIHTHTCTSRGRCTGDEEAQGGSCARCQACDRGKRGQGESQSNSGFARYRRGQAGGKQQRQPRIAGRDDWYCVWHESCSCSQARWSCTKRKSHANDWTGSNSRGRCSQH